MKGETFTRYVRRRGGSSEIVIPPPIVTKANLAASRGWWLNIWINQEWNIEMSSTSKRMFHVNGIVLNRRLNIHGGSYVVFIPPAVARTLEAIKGTSLKKWKACEIRVNKYGNAELRPINRDKSTPNRISPVRNLFYFYPYGD